MSVFGATCLTETDDTLAVHVGRSIILFATPDDLDMLHPELEASIDPVQPTLAALTVRVPDLAKTAAVLDRHDVAYRQDLSGAIGIAPRIQPRRDAGVRGGLAHPFRRRGRRARSWRRR